MTTRAATYIYIRSRGVFGSTKSPLEVAAELEALEPDEWYDIGNGTLVRPYDISYLVPVEA